MNLRNQYKRLFEGKVRSNDIALLRENAQAIAYYTKNTEPKVKALASKLKTAFKQVGAHDVYYDPNVDLAPSAQTPFRLEYATPGPAIVIQWKWELDKIVWPKKVYGMFDEVPEGEFRNAMAKGNDGKMYPVGNLDSAFRKANPRRDYLGIDETFWYWGSIDNTQDKQIKFSTTPNKSTKTLPGGTKVGPHAGPGSVSIIPIDIYDGMPTAMRTALEKGREAQVDPSEEPYQINIKNPGNIKATNIEGGVANVKIETITMMYWGDYIQVNSSVPEAEGYYNDPKFLTQLKAHALKLKSKPEYKKWIGQVEAHGQHTAADIERAIKQIDYTEEGMNTGGDVATEADL